MTTIDPPSAIARWPPSPTTPAPPAQSGCRLSSFERKRETSFIFSIFQPIKPKKVGGKMEGRDAFFSRNVNVIVIC
jgi:hypothetical protein